MFRRDGRESDSKRHHSRLDREPSPKRSRRDGKPETERQSSNLNVDSGDHYDRGQKHRRRLQDALPLEAPSAPDSKMETGAVSKESSKTTNGYREGTKHSSDPTGIPLPRSYFQHDDRDNAGQVGRRFGRGATTEHGWWRDSKDEKNERATDKMATNEMQQRDEKAQTRGDDNHTWRHDGYFEMEADPKPPARKRPAFSEKKISENPKNANKVTVESVKPSRLDRPLLGNERRDRGSHNSRHFDRPEKSSAGDRDEEQRGNFSLRDRYAGVGGGSYRGRDRFTARQGYRLTGVRVEKWKHDLFDEANRSPTPKNEDDQIAKVEALLDS